MVPGQISTVRNAFFLQKIKNEKVYTILIFVVNENAEIKLRIQKKNQFNPNSQTAFH